MDFMKDAVRKEKTNCRTNSPTTLRLSLIKFELFREGDYPLSEGNCTREKRDAAKGWD